MQRNRLFSFASRLLFVCSTLQLALAGRPPQLDGCAVFPPNNIWNTPIDHLPVDPNSATWVSTIGASSPLHPDFGSGTFQGGPIGIPFITVSGTEPRLPVSFKYASESDPGPYPIPLTAPIEGGSPSTGDRHVLALDRDNCVLYELFNAFPMGSAGWRADSGAVFDLKSNALRPETWTSADAAGLPILPGLVRYDEILEGEIRHPIRFTAPQTRRAYVWPARHFASSLTDSRFPPMGQRFRLRAGYDITGFSSEVQIILRALKKYGTILADNGSSWFISGAPDERWNNTRLRELRRLQGSDFEAVDTSSLMIRSDSAEARQPTSSLIFPHVAIGGGYTTTFSILNTGESAAEGTLELTGSDGRPLPALFSSAAMTTPLTAPSILRSIQPGGVSLLRAASETSTGPTVTGWARFDSSGGLAAGAAGFELVVGPSLRAAVGVLAATPAGTAIIPIDNDPAAKRFTGYSVANTGDEDLTIALEILDEGGKPVAAANPAGLNPLRARRHVARFVHEDFPSLGAFRGSMVLRAAGAGVFAAIALVEDRGQLTALPVQRR